MANSLLSRAQLERARPEAPKEEPVPGFASWLYHPEYPEGRIFHSKEAYDQAIMNGWFDHAKPEWHPKEVDLSAGLPEAIQELGRRLDKLEARFVTLANTRRAPRKK